MNTLAKRLTVIFLTGIFISFSGLMSCSGQGGGEKTAELVYVNWAEGIAYTNLAKVVLEEKMGYDVTITAADPGPAYTAVAQGDQDAFMETWLPVLHSEYYEEYQDDIVDLGYVYEGTKSGLVVPSYVTIDSISQLNEYADRFDGEITGIDPGAGVMQTTEDVIDMYNLDFELISSSGPAMTSALQGAVSDEEWIVVTGWDPHWMWAEWDLKFLQQDADKVVWETGNIHIMGRSDIKEAKPDLAQFLSNMHFTTAQIGDLMLQVRNSDASEEEIARKWMQENESLVNSWIPEGAAQTAAAQ
ncbi:MAG: glycine/betaine ABC transporter [Candidatus Marinimicrobia bacterium]|nr:glycine/betaine ABC transporter [Candidatus Neomarinimicrobiota bacterium]